MPALIPLFLANLPALISAGESLAGYISGTYAVLSQSAEWTEAAEEQFQAALKGDASRPEWQPDAKA